MTILIVRHLLPLAVLCVIVSGVGNVPAHRASASDLPNTPRMRGFHPIKKALAPIENLEGQGIKLEQDIMKLTGPISELSPLMTSLDTTMNSVNSQLGDMKLRLGSTGADVKAAREDIAGMRRDIHGLKAPVLALQKPIDQLSAPLSAIKQQLNIVVWAILVGGAATALGIPLSCIIFWKYRAKLIPTPTNEVPEVPAVQSADDIQHSDGL